MSYRDEEEEEFGYNKKLRNFFDDNEDWLNEKDDVLKNKKSVGPEMDEDDFNDRLGLFNRDENDLDFENDSSHLFNSSRSKFQNESPLSNLQDDGEISTNQLDTKPMEEDSEEKIMYVKPLTKQYSDGEYLRQGLPWSDAEKNFLQNNEDMKYKEMSMYLGRSPRSIKQKRYAMGDALDENVSISGKWTKNQLAILEEHIDYDHKELVKMLGKSMNAINNQIARIRGSVIDYVFTKKDNDVIKREALKKSDNEIAIKLNINPNTTRRQRVDMGHIRLNDTRFSEKDLAIDPRNIMKDDQTIHELYFGKLNGMKEIGNQINRGPSSFRHAILDTGVSIPELGLSTKVFEHFSGRYNIKIPYEKKEIFIGSLLGDIQVRNPSEKNQRSPFFKLLEYEEMLQQIKSLGRRVLKESAFLIRDAHLWNSGIDLIRETNTGIFRMNKSIQEFNWVKSIAEYLSNDYSIRGDVYPVNKPTQELQWNVYIETSASTQLGFIWKDWYEPKEETEKGLYNKIIPNNFNNLTPNIVLHWYTGDGSFSPNSHYFASDNFTLNEQKYLIKKLDEVGIKSTINTHSNVPRIGIKTARKNQKYFFEFLSEATFYEQAKDYLPHKFDKNLTHRSVLDNLRKERPEFFDPNAKITWDDL